MKHTFILLLFLFLSRFFCPAQDAKTAWDNTINKNWPVGFVPVEIISSADGKTQKAIFYKSHLLEKQPLIVSLHTWSGDYLRIQNNNQLFKKVALNNLVDFLDTYTSLEKKISEKTTDGVHLNEKAQFEMASEIANYLNRK